MRGTGAPRARESAPSSEAGWNQLETVEHLLLCGRHPHSLGLLILPQLPPVSLDDLGRRRYGIRIGSRGRAGSSLKPVGLPFCLGVWEKEQEPASTYIPL